MWGVLHPTFQLCVSERLCSSCVLGSMTTWTWLRWTLWGRGATSSFMLKTWRESGSVTWTVSTVTTSLHTPHWSDDQVHSLIITALLSSWSNIQCSSFFINCHHLVEDDVTADSNIIFHRNTKDFYLFEHPDIATFTVVKNWILLTPLLSPERTI